MLHVSAQIRSYSKVCLQNRHTKQLLLSDSLVSPRLRSHDPIRYSSLRSYTALRPDMTNQNRQNKIDPYLPLFRPELHCASRHIFRAPFGTACAPLRKVVRHSKQRGLAGEGRTRRSRTRSMAEEGTALQRQRTALQNSGAQLTAARNRPPLVARSKTLQKTHRALTATTVSRAASPWKPGGVVVSAQPIGTPGWAAQRRTVTRVLRDKRSRARLGPVGPARPGPAS